MSGKSRLDQHLISLGLFDSRAQAAAAIKAGQVRVDGQPARKASQNVSADAVIEAQAAHDYVSRGGLKLAAGLAHFGYPVEGRTALDVGASTGGFTDVLLRHHAAHVYAVDVGHGQLHQRLQTDPRVSDRQGVNARYLTADMFDRPLQALVCDASFISLHLVLASALDLMHSDAWLLALIKPQFEVGRDKLGKNGVVSDATLRQEACDRVAAWLRAHPSGWQVDGVMESPITGPQGNVEYIVAARRI